MKTLEALYKLGPFIGGVGVCITAGFAAGAAWWTALKYSKRSAEMSERSAESNERTAEMMWLERFRTLYGDFWNDEDAKFVRSWIASDKLYEDELKPILIKRFNDLENDKHNYADECQYKILEKIDKFCSLLVRMHFFEETNMSPRRRKLWNDIYGTFWPDKIRSRPELVKYITEFWHNDALENIHNNGGKIPPSNPSVVGNSSPLGRGSSL